MAVRRTTHHQGYRYAYELQGIEWPPRWPWWLTPSFPAPLVFVNGTFHSQESWIQYARHLGKKRTVVLVEFPGSGESGFLPERYGIDFLAGALKHVLDDEKIPRVNLVASSDGTVVAYRFAQLYPDRLASLILAGTLSELPPHLRPKVDRSLSSLQRGAMDEFAQHWVGALMCQEPGKTIANRRLAEGMLRTDLIRMPGPHRAKYLANAQRLMRHLPLDLSEAPDVRVLVFTGEHDQFANSEYCRAIAASFPAALFTTIQDADHLFHIERFETTAKLVEQFINDEPLEGIPEINAIEILRRSAAEAPAARESRVVIPMRRKAGSDGGEKTDGGP